MSLAELVITSVKVEGRTKSEVARDYRVSRYWVHQLVKRYEDEGEAAFRARSCRPHANPRAVDPQLEERIVRLRKELSKKGTRLRHIGLGREHARRRVLALVADRYLRVIDADTGGLLRELTLDPAKDYQPMGRPPGPSRRTPTAPADGVKAGRRPPTGPRP